MNYEYILYRIVVERLSNEEFREKELAKGIKAYARDNRLDILVTQLSEEAEARSLLQLYIDPILELPASYISAYFENYVDVAAVQRISASIYSLAQKKLHNEEVDKEKLLRLKEEINLKALALMQDGRLLEMMRDEISECMLDAAYAEGNTGKMSFRLANLMR